MLVAHFALHGDEWALFGVSRTSVNAAGDVILGARCLSAREV